MSLFIDEVTALADPISKKVFLDILKSRTLSRYQLEIDLNENKDKIDIALISLKEAGLIDKKNAEFEEWDKFYPTVSGLTVEKFVK